jgi:hypothetical protein
MPEEAIPMMRIEAGRLHCLTWGYYWFPILGDGSLTWEVLTCHDLGHDAGVGHLDFRPSVIDRLAEVWRKDAGVVRRELRDCYAGLPRGRVTRPGGRYLLLHRKDAPVADWLARVIRSFDLDQRSVRVVYVEYERMLPADRRLVEGILGLQPARAGRVQPRSSSLSHAEDLP